LFQNWLKNINGSAEMWHCITHCWPCLCQKWHGICRACRAGATDVAYI